jgi:uncharacterized protein (TIGR00251 family)
VTARLPVRIHPGARRSAMRGWHRDGRLKLEVAAPAKDGRANRAAVILIADILGVKKNQVVIVHGQWSRSKVFEIDGLDGAEMRRRIEETLHGASQ